MPPRAVLSMMLLIFSLILFFIGAMEFMLSPMLNPLADAFRTTIDKVTWLVSGYALAYALAAPIFGWLSDRINRHKLLRISLLFLFLDGLALTIAPNLEIAMGLRILGGIASAALIPTIFALVAELFPSHKQASAMGIVMLGMTVGIAGGPIVAGVLTELFYWQVPFLVSAAGCLLLYFLSKKYIPSQINILKTVHQTVKFQFGCQSNLIRPLIAKGFWNGTAVSAFILTGEVLRHHYAMGTGAIGISVSVFGIGLGLGNLSVSIVKHLNIRDECVLLLAIILLFITSSAFMLLPLSLLFSLACLMLWGCTLGLAAPISTSILAKRAKQDKGKILAISESLNNLTMLFLLPVATMLLSQYGTTVTVMILGSGFIVAIVLTLKDLLVTTSLN
ncbi:MFS transporter [Xenorhabdus griffiniae]|uniref:MFS transporter n=1 Tax=Xenorhabdus griffiniae TaxID=351672 RepID=A0ABY9XCR1_9GAMM|nr:MFS transporter [Xenorhabdus griffiniae]MBD1226432.1 MFS transporter [Xenorhabdus griffiniae]MBE8588023.1 MFS transporter [Xenorhabdus griffiniae]WMV70658.1 MFS transporter [Xenorhabdus griffiniae]WNH00335.1 MFS transporter [Xenorhabdus griffiniae]